MATALINITESDRDKLHQALDILQGYSLGLDCIADEVTSEHARNALKDLQQLCEAMTEDALPVIKAALYDLGEVS